MPGTPVRGIIVVSLLNIREFVWTEAGLFLFMHFLLLIWAVTHCSEHLVLQLPFSAKCMLLISLPRSEGDLENCVWLVAKSSPLLASC